MAKGTGDILHTVAVRYRAVGDGNLESFLHSSDDVRTAQLANIPLVPTTNREPTILANFQEQNTRLEGRTIVMDEWFFITKIIIFVKPIAEEYPQ